MYSRVPVPPPRRAPVGRPSYVRQRSVRPDFRVPPNYGGSAFQPHSVEQDLYATLTEQDRPPQPTDAPCEAPCEAPREAPHETMPREDAPSQFPDDTPGAVPVEPVAPENVLPPPPELFRGLQGFPFGHGIGFDELFLMGLIYFLLKEGEGCSDRGDLDQTVILLAVLLFCG